MASRRPGPQTFGWLGHRSRGSRSGEEVTGEEARSNPGHKATRTVVGPSHAPSRSLPQPSSSSRLPQASPTQRRPSDGRTERQALLPQPRVRGSASSTSSGPVPADKAQIPAATSAASSKLQPPATLKPRGVLRRKRSRLSQDVSPIRFEAPNYTSEHSPARSQPRCETPVDPLQLDAELPQSPPEIRIAHQIEMPVTKAQTVTIYPELDRYRDAQGPRSGSPGANLPYRIATHDLPPPTPLFSATSSQVSAFSGSPSTRWSESPGPGPYSRDTTPTSMSSQSPGLLASVRAPPPGTRTRQPDAPSTRPPVTRSRGGSISTDADFPQGLATVTEVSSNSSSGNSTVRAARTSTIITGAKEATKKAKESSKRAPSPPARKPSHRSKGSRDEGVVSPFSVPATSPPPPLSSSSSAAAKPTSLALPRPRFGQSKQVPAPLTTPPARPSREGTADLPVQLSRPIAVIQSNLSSTSLPDRRQSGLLAPAPVTRPTAPAAPGLTRSNTTAARRPSTKEAPSAAPKPAAASETSRVPSRQDAARHARTPSPAVSSGFKTRFPLFGRRTKTAVESDKQPRPPSQQQQQQQPKPETKPTRRGPAAGTGHEGYGKLGLAHRRNHSISHGRGVIPGTMSSQESLHSSLGVPNDPFLMQRMAPVIIAGGEVVENRNAAGSELTRTESNQSYGGFRRPSVESHNSSQLSISSTAGARNTLWPSPLPRGDLAPAGVKSPPPSLSSRRPSESSDSEAVAMKPTIALRRSVQRLRAAAAGAQVNVPKLPKPIVTSGTASVVSPSMTSLDASILSDDSVLDPSAEQASRPAKVSAAAASGSKKLTKPPRSPRRWNLFGRSQNRKEAVARAEPARTVAATVQAVKTKPVAFYAIMDPSDPDEPEPVDLEDVLREARGIAITTPPEEQTQKEEPAPESRRPSVANAPPSPSRSMQPPAEQQEQQPQQPQQQQPPRATVPPAATTSSTATAPVVSSPTKSPEPAPSPQARQPPPRPSRLPQVGRIPKVVSARAEHTSPKSFSRPFHRLSTQGASASTQKQPPPTYLRDRASIAKGPSPPKPSSPVPPAAPAPPRRAVPDDDDDDKPPHDTSNFSALIHGILRLSPPPLPPPPGPSPGDEFLRFSPRKDSQSTTATTNTTLSAGSSTSSCAALPGYVAAVPDAGAPLAEDEIWDEYNDLLGDDETVMMAMTRPADNGAEDKSKSKDKKGKEKAWPEPLRLRGASSVPGAEKGRVVEPPLESPTLSPPALPSLVQTLRDGVAADHPSIGAGRSEMALQVRKMLGDEDEKTGSLADIVATAAAAAAAAESEIPQDDAEHGVPATTPLLPPADLSNAQGEGEPEQAGEADPVRRSNASSSCTTSTHGSSDSNSPASQVNLRVGSMTVSRWLTFGHVLFSPVRDELLLPPTGSTAEPDSLQRPCILVVDGLGNDDWSFYAAETYPAATFFNLSPRAPLKTLVQQQRGSHSSTLSSSALPLIPPNHHQVQWHLAQLPKFPFAAGSFTAVVFRFPAAGPESHYRHVISEARRVLQPGGYLELSILDVDLNNMGPRCRRAVRRLKERVHARAPQTSLAPASDLVLKLVGRRGFVDVKTCRVGVPVAGVISTTTTTTTTAMTAAAGQKKKEKQKRIKDPRSLPEMINDEGPVADESIARSVARVGRWWYSRCYEGAATAGDEWEQAGRKDSLWRDRELLAECQEWGTSLKLMVCHARAPLDGRARVASI
ncbi:hypothetical protein VTJ83DRAFT_3355 [Remersonia thermophila]|uniref:Methyltransferase type 11 domain-containing protein n=1 Tax=Remersonia thermophila TaxID=72144 RepID=A0ABR4DDW6_9PEZI